ncbi:MAG: ATP-dependent Clp protease proteolytic subunit [Flavobacteriales bacterium]|nr:ATP-dependent Clp protease proteolytic subunit [Flavobacteriales bacterium]
MIKRPLHITAKRNGKRADVRIEGVIASYTRANARDFEASIDALVASGVADGHVYIDSEGGSVLEAKRILGALRKLTGRITGEGGPAVMSAATYIGLHLDEFRVQSTTSYMIHKPKAMVDGDEDEVEKDLKGLRDVTKEYRAAYAKKTGKSEEDIEALWSKGNRWYTGEEAVAEGFVDGLVEDEGEEINEEAVARIAACGCPANKLPKASSAKTKTTTMDINLLRATLGMPETATEAEVLARLNALKASEAKAKADAIARRTQEVKSILDKAVAEKRMTEAHRASYEAKFAADFDATKAEVEALVAAPNVARETGADGGSAAVAKGRENWTYAEWMEKDEKGLNAMRKDNPEAFEALWKAQYGK